MIKFPCSHLNEATKVFCLIDLLNVQIRVVGSFFCSYWDCESEWARKLLCTTVVSVICTTALFWNNDFLLNLLFHKVLNFKTFPTLCFSNPWILALSTIGHLPEETVKRNSLTDTPRKAFKPFWQLAMSGRASHTGNQGNVKSSSDDMNKS